ncbi:MAG: hypothetical protein ACXVBW_08215, partial [Bdellovibrionota bacterium]
MSDQKSSVHFVSLGCPKNLVDSQVMLGLLEKDRYTITRSPDDADVIIVNTCSFIEASKEESIETILEMAQQKENGKCKVLVASGCLPQRYAKVHAGTDAVGEGDGPAGVGEPVHGSPHLPVETAPDQAGDDQRQHDVE